MEPSRKKAKVVKKEKQKRPSESSSVDDSILSQSSDVFSAISAPSPSSSLSAISSSSPSSSLSATSSSSPSSSLSATSASSPSSTLSRRLSSLPSPPPIDPRELLPVEMWHHILSFLPLKDGLCAGRSCSLFYHFFVRKPLSVPVVEVSSKMVENKEDHVMINFGEKRSGRPAQHLGRYITDIIYSEKQFRLRENKLSLLAYCKKSLLRTSLFMGPKLIHHYEWHPLDNRCYSLALCQAELVAVTLPTASPPQWLGIHPNPPALMTILMNEVDVDGVQKWMDYCHPSGFKLVFPNQTPTPPCHDALCRAVIALPQLHSLEGLIIDKFPAQVILTYQELSSIKAHTFELFGVTLENAIDILRGRILDWMVSHIPDDFTWFISPANGCFSDTTVWKKMFPLNKYHYLGKNGCLIVMADKMGEVNKKLLILDRKNPSRYLILNGFILRTFATEKEIPMLEKYQRKHSIIV